jgi:serine/threonine protein kinase/tetratricopeptide (TPR) repeat protein
VNVNTDFAGTERFEIVRRLGAGGTGVVYEALDRDRNARVALKTLRSLSAEGILLFKKEFRALQDVQHPNLISLGELIEARGQWFFTMELLQGVDFMEYVRPAGNEPIDFSSAVKFAPPEVDPSRPPPSDPTPSCGGEPRAADRLDESRLRAALVQLARGLASLHASNKVHRDIKPSNILVTPADRAVLLDFGLVTDLAAGALSDNLLVGTVAYMAPEQAAFRRVGPEADWYSVGVLLYFALTGQLPFDGHAADVLMRKQCVDPPSPSLVAPSHLHDLEELCMDLLHINPSRRPTADQVLQRLGVSRAIASLERPAPKTDPFIGRRDEIGILRAALQRTRAGHAAVTCVHGESGVGKTALVRHFIDGLPSDVVVLIGRCYERESVPYKALDDIVDSLSHFMAALDKDRVDGLLPRMAGLLPQLFPVLGRVNAFAETTPPSGLGLDLQETRTRSFTALRELLGSIASWRPLVLVIDDYQWTDADSVALLVEIVRPPKPPPLLLVCMTRSEEGRPPSVSVPGEVEYLKVGRLAPEEAYELASELVAVDGVERSSERLSAASIVREANGHPLFIDELVRHSRHIERGAALHLDEALWSRVEQLEPSARALVEVVCVAGAPIAEDVAARAVGEVNLAELSRRVAGLRLANLVRTTGSLSVGRLEPYHDRVREAVMANLDDGACARWHGQIALAMESSLRVDAEALAMHFREAGRLEKAASYGRQAAKLAETSLAFDRAASLLRQVLELGLPTPPDASALQTRLANALANAGRGREAAHAYLTAAQGASADDALDLRRRAADQLLRVGHIDEGLSVLGDVLAAQGMTLPRTSRGALTSALFQKALLSLRGHRFTPRTVAEIPASTLRRVDVCWSTTVGLALVDFVHAADFHARTMRFALDAGEIGRLALAYSMAFAFAMGEGGTALHRRAPRLLDKAETLARRTENPYALAWIPLARGIGEFYRGAWKQSLSLCAEAETLFRDYGRDVAWELATAKAYGLWSLGYMGEFKELARRVVDGLHEARERGDRFALVLLSTGSSHYVHLANDDPEASRRESTDALREWSQAGFHLQHLLDLFVQVETDLYEGDALGAFTRISDEWPRLERSMLLRVQNARIFMMDLRARAEVALAVARGGDSELLRAAERRAHRIGQERMAWGDHVAASLLGCIARARKDDRVAARLFERAASGFDAMDMVVHGAAARERLGDLLGGDEGGAHRARAREVLARQAIKDPARFVGMLAPT